MFRNQVEHLAKGGNMDPSNALDELRATSEAARRQELLSRDDIAREYKGISRRWLELAALNGRGPPMVRLSARMVRYQRGAFEDWLESHVVSNTSQQTNTSRGCQK
ncbi:helix-turn-helix transcriptional regulator [Roseovarius aestuarii]|uniref:Uncharacterized protein n=1 Tax=Roseovarius aestuarii TaxID=475083 RepID=A0A1X7BZK3_9RHOB|nr:hypothetical protein ROA7745_04579 [Roseovarius aestuarii]